MTMILFDVLIRQLEALYCHKFLIDLNNLPGQRLVAIADGFPFFKNWSDFSNKWRVCIPPFIVAVIQVQHMMSRQL